MSLVNRAGYPDRNASPNPKGPRLEIALEIQCYDVATTPR